MRAGSIGASKWTFLHSLARRIRDQKLRARTSGRREEGWRNGGAEGLSRRPNVSITATTSVGSGPELADEKS
jgi:hypothetical protein